MRTSSAASLCTWARLNASAPIASRPMASAPIAHAPTASAPSATAPSATAPVATAPFACTALTSGDASHFGDLVEMWLEAGRECGCLFQVRRRRRVAEHGFEVLTAPPLRVVGHAHAVEALVDRCRNEARDMPDGLVRSTSQQVNELLLSGRFDGEHVDECDDIVACVDAGHACFDEQVVCPGVNPAAALYEWPPNSLRLSQCFSTSRTDRRTLR